MRASARPRSKAAVDAAGRARDAVEQAIGRRARGRSASSPSGLPTMLEARAGPPASRPRPEDESLRSFSDRADRLVARLQALQRIPLRAPATVPAPRERRPGRRADLAARGPRAGVEGAGRHGRPPVRDVGVERGLLAPPGRRRALRLRLPRRERPPRRRPADVRREAGRDGADRPFHRARRPARPGLRGRRPRPRRDRDAEHDGRGRGRCQACCSPSGCPAAPAGTRRSAAGCSPPTPTRSCPWRGRPGTGCSPRAAATSASRCAAASAGWSRSTGSASGSRAGRPRSRPTSRPSSASTASAGAGAPAASSRAPTASSSAEFAAAAERRGWLRLWIAEIDGEPVAAWYGWRFAGSEWYYQAGRDARFDELSLGFVLLAHTVREACADGVAAYRFLDGAEPYKWRFASADLEAESRAFGAGPGGRAVAAGGQAAARLRGSLRRARRGGEQR